VAAVDSEEADMPHRYDGGEGTAFGEVLPVPEAEADLLLGRVAAMIEALDQLVLARDQAVTARLGTWQGPARTTWDDDATYAQLDLQATIDALQAFRGRVATVIEDLRAHNRSVASITVTGTTTTSTTSTTSTTTTTTQPSGGGR
jgi:hypothetical protein